MSEARKIVDQMLSEAPVPPDQVGNPGRENVDGGVPVYKMIKAEDIPMSDALNTHLGEATEDGAVANIGDLQYTGDHMPEFAEECESLVTRMEQLGIDYILL